MTTRGKIYIVIGLLLIAGVVFGAHTLISKKSSTPSVTTTPQATNTEDTVAAASMPQPGEGSPSPVKEPVVTPNPVKVIVPPALPLPVGTDQFVVSLTAANTDIATSLATGGYITDTAGFVAILGKDKTPVSPGAYKISNTMTPSQLDKVLHGNPYMKWVVIPPGLRKEEIAALLTKTLGWTTKQEKTWISTDTMADPNYLEGVYYPDTYLIPLGEAPSDTAKRLIAKFNENFAPYLPQFTAQNIKWTTALTLASIVQREAANDADMPLIAGILWNRLNQNIALGVDATLQYARGDTGKGWWAPISVADKQIDSPYNTYKYKGLPPHPISNPSIPAIEAVLNPTATDCIYYLHDKNHVTHCAATYAEHQANIQKYLVGTTSTSTSGSTTTSTSTSN
jgi:UPF0755 protein